MPRSLPARPDLAHLKKQAKALVQSGAAPRLVDAQLQLAREYGFPSWTKLKRHVESLSIEPLDALVSAVKTNDVGATTRVLEQYPALRSRLNDPLPGLAFDSTVLHAAVSLSNAAMVDLLVRAGADINVRTHWWAGGFDALDLCSPDFAPFLIDRGATLTVNSAARLGRMTEVERLVRADPELVRARGGDGQTPLHVAATVEVARFLVENGADINALDVDHESTPAQYAVRERQDVARYLVSLGCHTDILMASALGDLALVQRFLNTDPSSIESSVNDQSFPKRNPRAGGSIYIWTLGSNKTPHGIAREFGHEDVFRLLISRTSDALKLALACERGDKPAVEELLTARSDLASTLGVLERRRLVVAAENNNLQAVQLMLGAGWPVDTRGEHGETALHWAAWHGNVALTRAILEHRPSMELRDGQYDAPPLGWGLHGSQNGWHRESADYPATIDALITAGAIVPRTDKPEASPSVLAVLRQHGIDIGGL